jgi:hypothetical protein
LTFMLNAKKRFTGYFGDDNIVRNNQIKHTTNTLSL